MKRYGKYIKPYLYAFILGPVFMILEVLGEVFMPRLMKEIIDQGVVDKDIHYIILIGLIMVGTAAIMLFGGVGGAYFAVKASSGFAAGLRNDVFKKVQEFSFANIEKYSTGSLVTRLTNDITILQNIVSMALRMMLRAPGLLIGGLIMAILLNPQLAMVLLIMVPVLLFFLVLIMRVAFPRFEEMQGSMDQLNSRIQENITNVRVVKSFVSHDSEKETFAVANERLREKSIRATKVVIFSMPVMMLTMNLTTVLVVWFGGQQILIGGMSVGSLTAFTTYIVQILMSLMFVAMFMMQGSRAVASSHRILEILDTKVDLNDDDAKEKEATIKNGKIEFVDVAFRYYQKKDHNVLENISFTIQPGEVVGILGGTGSGKTSLVQLIPRLYDVSAGKVLIDDIDVKDYSLLNLRNEVGMVLQNNTLFSGTIRDNLRWGNELATNEEIEEIARYAQAHNFIEGFTLGYDTMLGQGGVNVSGGQKQRLCIARALLKRPKILILDDSTSAVDTATETEIRKIFTSELSNTTKLIIAQRISSVIDADKIIVLDEGKIVGMGTHKELFASCNEYQEIYYSQKDKVEVDAL